MLRAVDFFTGIGVCLRQQFLSSLKTCIIFFYFFSLFLFNPCVAFAQILPGSVDPARVQETIIKPDNKPETKTDFLENKRLSLAPPPSPVIDGFVLNDILVEGSSVFSKDALKKTYTDYLGKKVDLGIVQFIAERITQAYRDQGYFLSRALVPEQEVQNGIVRVVVVEGYVSNIRVEGDALSILQKKDFFNLFEKISGAIKSMRPLKGEDLERQLLLMDDLAGIRVQAVMEALPPPEAAPGAVGMLLKVTPGARELTASLDNFGSRFVGPFQLSARGALYNNFLAFDRLSLNAMTALPVREIKSAVMEYDTPFFAQDLSLGLQLGYTTLAPGYTLDLFDVKSRYYTAGVKLSKSLVRSRKKNAFMSFNFDISNITTDYLGAELYNDRIRAMRVSGDFDWIDNLQGRNSAILTLSQGLDILGARETGSNNLSRATGHSDFTKINGKIDRLQQIGARWELYGSLTGQYSWDPLLSSEEFGYGGQAFGRAYDPSEITGDHGVAAAAELRFLGLRLSDSTAFQPFVFYDIGKVWKPDAASNQEIISGASTGIGLRFLRDDRLSGDFSLAFPLTRMPASPQSYADDGDFRLLFTISSQF